MAAGITQAPVDSSPIDLLAQFLRMEVIFQLEEIKFSAGYPIGIKLGEGTTYVVEKWPVYKIGGVKPSTGDWVAVKRSKSIIPKDPNKAIAMPSESLRRLKTILLEIEVMFHPPLRSHPNIAQLLGFSWDNEAPGYTPLLVMELASHGTLAEFLSAENTTNHERRQLCLDVVLGLEVLHNSMIIHGDVKQDNVLVFPHSSRRIIAKLSDFGLALFGDSEPVYRGTPIYNAPEIHLYNLQNNQHNFTVSETMSSDLLIKCDAFSFGLLCFEIFMGGQQYYRIPDTEPFRTMLFAGASDAALFMNQAIDLSRIESVPIGLMEDCRSVLKNTLSPSPTSRLKNGWNDIKQIFGMQPPAQSKDLPDITPSLQHTTSARPSMLEFHYHPTFGGDLLKSLISELHIFADSSEKREESAQAAFDLCLLSSISVADGVFSEDAVLDWLTKAQFNGHYMAGQLAPRIFGARQTPMPPQMSVQASSDINWYAEAVRVHGGNTMRIRIIRDLQNHVFREQITSSQLRERLIRCSQDARSLESTESSFLVHLATANNNPDILQSLLDHGANINARTPSGITALHIASIMGNVDILRLLVQRGADASINDSKNISPIHWLVLFPNSDIDEAAELLVHARVNIRSYVENFEFYLDDLGLALRAGPLHWAVMCRNHSAISALLRHCEHLESTNSDCLIQEDKPRDSAVDAALGTVCADTLEILLQHNSLAEKMTVEEKQMCWRKVAYKCSNKFQRWCIHGDHFEAAFTDIIAVFHRYGIEYTDDFDLDSTMWTPLIRASLSYNLPWAKALIQDGADINFRPMDGTGTAMEMAIHSAQFSSDIYAVVKFVKLLFESGASMEPVPLHPNGSDKMSHFSDEYRLGALHLAVRHGAGVPLVQYLLQQVPEQVNQKYEGKPLLTRVPIVYTETDACRIASLLLAAGADPNAETDHREGYEWNCCHTAAVVAIRFNGWSMLKLLLDHDITLNFGVSGAHERSILHFALKRSLETENNHYISSMNRRDQLDVMELLLSHSISARHDLVNKTTLNGISPLLNAVFFGLPAHITILLQHGADIYLQWHNNSIFNMIDRLRKGEIDLPFVVDDEMFEDSKTVYAGEAHIMVIKRSQYFSRLDEIESLLQHWVVLKEEHDSAVARNTSSRLRLLPSTL
jgi:ankyrin repeat protein